MHPFQVSVSCDLQSVHLRVVGEIDLSTAAQLVDAVVVAHASSGHDVVIDLSGVTLLDCSGVSALVQAYDQLAAIGAQVALVNPSTLVADVLARTGADAHLGCLTA